MIKIAPLPHEYMIASIIGFFVSVFFVWNLSKTWGFTFALFFVIMFIASIISLSSAGTSDADLKYMQPDIQIYKTKKL